MANFYLDDIYRCWKIKCGNARNNCDCHTHITTELQHEQRDLARNNCDCHTHITTELVNLIFCLLYYNQMYKQ